MADVHTKEQRSRNMAAIKGRGNETTEQAMVHALRSKRITGWRRHQRKLPGTPDFVFIREKTVVFVDGCFWHGCKKCYVQPKTNSSFWKNKIEKNRSRDVRINRQLRRMGWHSIRVWEHRLKNNPNLVAESIGKRLNNYGTRYKKNS